MNAATTGLEPLLGALRADGIRIGPPELLRLRRVLAAPRQPRHSSGPADDESPEDSRRRLRAMLRATLLTRPEDRERFDQLFDDWYGPYRDALEATRPRPISERLRNWSPPLPREPDPPIVQPPPIEPAPRRPCCPRWRLLLALLLAELLLGAALRLWLSQPTAMPLDLIDRKPPDEQIGATPPEPPPTPASYLTRVPTIAVQPVAEWPRWPAPALALLALAAAGWTWRQARRRLALPEPLPPPAPDDGPPRLFLPAPTAGDDPGLLLTRAEQGRLVWGIGRFVTGRPTRRLDLRATVRATAERAGLPAPRFIAAERHRAVWLWTDGSTADPQLRRLADGITALLGGHGLDVERADYHAIPDALSAADGHRFSPREIAERRSGALVCILTDGELMARLHATDKDARLRIDALLRLLGHWPRLAWVDLGDGALAALLQPHGLHCIPPAELIGFLLSPDGSPRRRSLPRSRVAAELPTALWAALCALPPAPIEEAEALALRRHLNLGCPPWDLARLRDDPPGPGGRLHWSPARRGERLRWLADLARAGEAHRTLLHRALDYWDQCYAALLERDPSDTAARRRLRAERALLGLWRAPGPRPDPLEQTIDELHALAGGDSGELIRSELRGLAPADAATDRPCIRLPWSSDRLGPRQRRILQRLEFGCGGVPRSPDPRLPGRYWLGIGLCIGLAAGALAKALVDTLTDPRPTGEPIIVHRNADDLAPVHRLIPDADGGWLLTALSPDQLAHRAGLAPGSRVEVTWQPQDQPCIELLEDGAELHRCAAGGAPVPSPDAIGAAYRRLAVLAAPADGEGVRDLAAALLTGGSAHQVLIDPGWPARRAVVTGPDQRLHAEDRLLLLTAADATPMDGRQTWLGEARMLQLGIRDWSAPTAALAELEQGRCRPAGEVWSDIRVLAGDAGEFPVGGTGLPDDGITFIELPGGELQMGSPEDEEGRYSDEGPRHRVRVSPFALARTETTNAQYRRLHPDHDGDDGLPVVYVNWDEARAFCEAVGGRLPTEAEWEYAARAGTDGRWSFGDDEALLGDHAWYVDNSDDKAHPVATRKPNPWGLYDMHGNVWEWVADWYEERYTVDEEPRIDPTGPASGASRVLRGGAFDNRARDLRSADRVRVRPVNRLRFLGFRCARGPRRQLDP